jgi:hypothetical protein
MDTVVIDETTFAQVVRRRAATCTAELRTRGVLEACTPIRGSLSESHRRRLEFAEKKLR